MPAPVDLAAVCRQVVAELEGLHLEGGVTFTAEGDLRGEWDSDRIAQVVSNLLRNAIVHGERNEPIQLVARGDDDGVVVEVQNRGPAIPPNAQATIFEPMVRSAGAGHRGLGLGLYVTSRLVPS